MDSYSNFVINSTANLTTGCTISEVEFFGNVIELSPEAQSLIEFKIQIKYVLEVKVIEPQQIH